MQLWFHQQLSSGSCVYNLAFEIRLQGQLNAAALEASLAECMRRHEALRTRFAVVDGTPVQAIGDTMPTWRLVDLRTLPEEQKLAEIRRLADQEVGQPFEIGRGPLVRFTLLRISESKHVLLFGVHHIAFDGWSMDVWRRDLLAAYERFVQTGTARLPDLAVQYADYAAWQRTYLQSEAAAASLAFWRQELANVPVVLDLPNQLPHAQRSDRPQGQASFRLAADKTADLRRLATRHDCTPFAVLLTAFTSLLHRLTGQSRLLVGVPFAGRSGSELESTVGFFVNTVPVRSDCEGDPRFGEMLQAMQARLWNIQARQDYPFEELVKALRPQRMAGRNPFYQVLAAYEVWTRVPVKSAGLEVEVSELTPLQPMFDLTVLFQDWGDDLEVVILSDPGVYETWAVAQLARHYQNLLDGAMADPQTRLSVLPLLSAPERKQMIEAWNNTAQDFPRGRCIHQLFEAQVERTPDAVAVVFEHEQLTYHQLDTRAIQLALHLRRLGVVPAARVGICMERSPAMLIGVLGILKAGAAYVPLDPSHPIERLAFILEDAGPRVLVVQSGTLRQLESQGPVQVTTVTLDAIERMQPTERATDFFDEARSDSIAYVLYTSGSTGRPKGVEIRHSSVVNFLHSMRQSPGLSAGDVLLAVTTLSFDISALELFLPLTVGARVVIAPQEALSNGELLARLIREHRVTALQATPTTWRLLLETGWQGAPGLKALCGGESWTGSLAAPLKAKCQSLWNMYGPTETTIWSTIYQVDNEQRVLMGKPIANTQVYLLDAASNPVPIGVAGELHIGGDGLAQGYLNRPELTAEKFIPNPFSSEPGARLYKTGDLCRFLPDGNIEFLGRLDHQVKIRGFRIELGEIEAVLGSHPAVQGAVVLAKVGPEGDKKLVAYVALPAGTPTSVGELREYLKIKLPEYMVPAAIVRLDGFPLNANGKLDRAALPEPDESSLGKEAEYVAPRTAAEKQLAAIWAEVLGVAKIGIQDNLFDLGGHSLLAARLAARIGKAFQSELPLLTLFQHPTIEGLAKVLVAHDAVHHHKGLVLLQTGTSRTELFLIGFQGGLSLFNLGRLLDTDMSVHSSLAPLPKLATLTKAERKTILSSSIEDLAGAHARLIRRQLNGQSCFVAGHCFGGILAFEVAHQLLDTGTRVNGVLLLDTWMTHPSRAWWLLTWMRTHMHNSFRLGPRYFISKLRTRLKVERRRLSNRLTAAEYDPEVDQLYARALKAYSPKALDVSGVLLLPGEDWAVVAHRKADPTLGVRPFFKRGLRLVEVPGNHVTMLKEANVESVAEEFSNCLRMFASSSTNVGSAMGRIS
jgi:amino acid adenylation domain-containing protein